MVSYNKLWHLLIDKKMRKSDLLNATGISPATLAKMTHDEDVTTIDSDENLQSTWE